MAITTIKSTYSLDVDSVRTLEALADRWSVSKSEVIRRALRIAAMTGDDTDGGLALEALTRLQDRVRERGVDLAQWGRDLDAERRAAGRRLRFGGEGSQGMMRRLRHGSTTSRGGDVDPCSTA